MFTQSQLGQTDFLQGSSGGVEEDFLLLLNLCSFFKELDFTFSRGAVSC